MCTVFDKTIKNTFPSSSLRTLYFALIHPHVMYRNLAWSNALPVLLLKTELIQKRAVRTINKCLTIVKPAQTVITDDLIINRLFPLPSHPDSIFFPSGMHVIEAFVWVFVSLLINGPRGRQLRLPWSSLFPHMTLPL